MDAVKPRAQKYLCRATVATMLLRIIHHCQQCTLVVTTDLLLLDVLVCDLLVAHPSCMPGLLALDLLRNYSFVLFKVRAWECKAWNEARDYTLISKRRALLSFSWALSFYSKVFA